jgi:hypothetical protein
MIMSNLKQLGALSVLLFMSWLIIISYRSKSSPIAQDMSTQIEFQEIPLVEGQYSSAVWLESGKITLKYQPSLDITSQNIELVFINQDGGEWNSIRFTKPEECDIGRYGRINKLPDGRLGFVYDCTIREPSWKSYYSLYAWNADAGNYEQLLVYPRYFRATNFTVSPLTGEIVQERGGVTDIYPELYLTDIDGSWSQFVPEFFRAVTPAWSADGRQLAFLANEVGPRERFSIFTGLVGLNNILDYPWDLYLADEQLGDFRIILSGIQHPRLLRWSPDGKWLAFSGRFSQESGIFAFNPETRQLVRIWARNQWFDWSPDSTKLVTDMIDDPGISINNNTQPVIIDLSFLTDR